MNFVWNSSDISYGFLTYRMFMSSCKRLRIMKGSEAKGLGCVAWKEEKKKIKIMEGFRGRKIEGLGSRRRTRRTECRIVIIKIFFFLGKDLSSSKMEFFFFLCNQTNRKREASWDLQRKLGVFLGNHLIWWYGSSCNLIIFEEVNRKCLMVGILIPIIYHYLQGADKWFVLITVIVIDHINVIGCKNYINYMFIKFCWLYDINFCVSKSSNAIFLFYSLLQSIYKLIESWSLNLSWFLKFKFHY